MRHSPPQATTPAVPLDVTVVQTGKVSIYRIVDPKEAALIKAAIERAAEGERTSPPVTRHA